MANATMTSKGQVTIPAAVRADLRLVAGSKLTFEKNAAGETVLRTKTTDVRELRDFFKYRGPTMTLEEIDDGIAEAIAERVNRR